MKVRLGQRGQEGTNTLIDVLSFIACPLKVHYIHDGFRKKKYRSYRLWTIRNKCHKSMFRRGAQSGVF